MASSAEKRAYTAPVGQQITWRNPENGNTGTITPTGRSFVAVDQLGIRSPGLTVR